MGEALLTVLLGSVNREPGGPPHRVPDCSFKATSMLPSATAQTPARSYLSVVSLSLFRESNSANGAGSIAHVPFDFLVGDVHFRAGAYAIESRKAKDMFHVHPAGAASPEAFVQASCMPPQRDGMSRKLLFYRQNGTYHLAQVLSVADESV